MIKVIKKIFLSDFGAILVSILLGFGLASLFRNGLKYGESWDCTGR